MEVTSFALQIAQRVLVRTINAISLVYFAVSERDLSFFLSKWSDLPAKNCSTFEP
jgi:hypothetical protein